jgi:hypothetical protein
MQWRAPLFLLVLAADSAVAFLVTGSPTLRPSLVLSSTSTSSKSTTDEFASFAASLEEPERSTSTTSTGASSKATGEKNQSWQEDLEELLDPLTPLARRQILLSDLMSANADIQASVQTALRDRRVRAL